MQFGGQVLKKMKTLVLNNVKRRDWNILDGVIDNNWVVDMKVRHLNTFRYIKYQS